MPVLKRQNQPALQPNPPPATSRHQKGRRVKPERDDTHHEDRRVPLATTANQRRHYGRINENKASKARRGEGAMVLCSMLDG